MHNSTRNRTLSEKTDLLLDAQFGVLKYLGTRPSIPGLPSFFHSYSQACSTKIFTGISNATYGGGASMYREHALAKAIGEAVERYCSAIYSSEDLPFCSFDVADFSCVNPMEFALYSTDQCSAEDFMFRPFTSSTPVRWVPALDYGSGAEIALPASLAFVPYFFHVSEDEVPINQPISTGQSCHDNLYRACIGSVCEVVERDAFTITWQAVMAHPRIDVKTLPSTVSKLLSGFPAPNGQILLFDITMDNRIPSIMSVMIDDSGWGPPVAIATATHPNPLTATIKSLEELAHTRYYLNRIFNIEKRLPPDFPKDNILNEFDHLNYWCDIQRLEQIQFLINNTATKPFNIIENLEKPTLRDTWENLAGQILQSGYRILLVDLTTRDIRDVGLHVIRAVIPGYHPLAMGYKYRVLGGKRLWTIPQKLDFPGINKDSGDNPLPHPFP